MSASSKGPPKGPKEPKTGTRGLFGEVEDADIDLALEHWDEWDLEGKPSAVPLAPAPGPTTPASLTNPGRASAVAKPALPAHSAPTRVAPEPAHGTAKPRKELDDALEGIFDDDFGLSGPAEALGGLLGTDAQARRPEAPARVDDDLLGGGDDDIFANALAELDLESAASPPIVSTPPAARDAGRRPATISREDLAERRRAPVSSPPTLSQDATRASPAPEAPPAEVDDFFYDQIQVASSSEDSSPSAEPAVVRRLTRNVVRRGPAIAPAPARPVSPRDEDQFETVVNEGPTRATEVPEPRENTQEVVIGEGSSIELVSEENDPDAELDGEPVTSLATMPTPDPADVTKAAPKASGSSAARRGPSAEDLDDLETVQNDDAPPPPVTSRRSHRPWREAVPEPVVSGDSGRVSTRTPAPDDGSFEVRGALFALPEHVDGPSDGAWLVELAAVLKPELEVVRDPARLAAVQVGAARAALAAGTNDRARELLEEARQGDPTSVAARRALRRIYAAEKRPRDMATLLEEESRLSEGAARRALLSLRADLLLAAGEDDLARVAVGELLDAAPDDPGAQLAAVTLAFSDDRMGELATAAAAASKTIADPELVAALERVRALALERLAVDAGGASDAERRGSDSPLLDALAGALLASPNDPPLRLAAARAAQAGHDPTAAEGHLAAVASAEVPAVLAAAERRFALALSDQGDAVGAGAALDRAVAAQPDDPLVLEAHARSCERADRLADAARSLEAWAACEPAPARRAEVLRRAAGVHKRLGDAPAAAWALRRAWQSDPGDALLGGELVQAYVAAGDVDSAVALERAKMESPDVGAGAALALRMQASAMLERAERLADALDLLGWPASAAPNAPGRAQAVVLDRTVRLLERLGKHADVLALHAAAPEPAADYRDVALRRMRGAFAAQRMAWRVLAVGVREAGLGELHTSADEALAARREAVERALTAWQRVLDVDPASPMAHLASTRLVLELGDAPSARIVLDDARRATRRPAAAADLLVLRHVVAKAGATGTATAPELGSSEPRTEITSGDEEALAEGIAELLAREPGQARTVALAVRRAAEGPRWDEIVRLWLDRLEALPPGPEHDALAYRTASALHERLRDDPRAVDVLGPVASTRPLFGGALLLLESAYRRLGDASALAGLLPAGGGGEGERGGSHGSAGGGAEGPLIDVDLRFARLIRMGELLEERVKDPARALALYQRALALRPDDPEAREGFVRTAAAARELHQLSERALGRLKAAQDSGDLSATVAAYEDLAWIDGELRGEPPLAKATWASIAALVPGHHLAQRLLERDAVAEDRREEIASVWEAVEATLVVDQRAPWTAARAALLESAKRPELAVAASRAALAALGDARPPVDLRLPLVRLDAALRGEGDAGREDLARVQDAAAALLADDPRALAAFSTRAGQLLEELGRTDDALARYRRAVDASPGHAPALEGWRRTALAAERWAEACDAAERGAAVATGDDEKVALGHLAGVIAMDRGLAVERAIQALRKVIQVRPRHDDAYARLRQLLERADRPGELAELLTARLETELDKRRSLELHRVLAALYRDRLGDLDRAKAHLRAVMAQGGPELATVASLSDIAWGKEQWAEAAELLILRARLEERPADVKQTFTRLGMIYAEKLPDHRWALKSFERVLAIDPDDPVALEQVARLAEQAGDLSAAVTASERLASLEPRPDVKITLLHRLARVYEEGIKDAHRAEDALRRALDTDHASVPALAQLASFYQRRNDSRSMRVQIDRVCGSMRTKIARGGDGATIGAAFGVLARALAMRGKLGVVGSLEAARCAAEVAVALGGTPDGELAALNETLRGGASARGLGEAAIDDALTHPGLPGGARQLFSLVGEVLAKRFPPDLRRWGVGRGEKVGKGALRELVEAVGGELGVRDVDVFVSKAQPRALGVEATDPVSVIVGAEVLGDAKPAAVWFAVGRAVKIHKMGLAIPARLGPEDLGLFIAGLIRQFDPGFSPSGPGLTLASMGEEQQRLSRLIPKKLLAELAPYAAVFTGQRFDAEAWFGALVHTANRAGLIASGGMLGPLTVLQRAGNHLTLEASLKDPQVAELLRFSVSEEHVELRRQLAGG